MKQNFFRIANENSTPVIYIKGEIGWDCNYDDFRNAIVSLITAGHNRIKMVINSVGGSMTEGFAMYDFIKSLNIIVEVEIIGIAASMAGIISQCATKGLLGIHRNALVMTHKPQTRSSGESNQLREDANTADKLEEKAKNIFKARGVKEDDMKDWFMPGVMKWHTAEECITTGICDYVIGATTNNKLDKPIQSFPTESTAYKYFNTFFNTPDKPKSIQMNKLLISVVLMLNKAGVTTVNAESSEDEVIRALNAYETETATKLKNLGDQVLNVAKTRAADLINNAIQTGKLPNDLSDTDKAKWVQRAEKDYDSVNDILASAPTKAVDINAGLNRSTATTTTTNGKEDRSKWNLLDYEKNDPAYVKNLMTNKPEEYRKMFKECYGSDPF